MLLALFTTIRKFLFRTFLGSQANPPPSFPNSLTPCIPSDAPRQPNTLYVYMPALRPWGYPNASPFSMKLETFLRMAEIPYIVIWGMDLEKAPKGKVPFIEWNGQLIGDSEFIFKFLTKTFPNHKLTDSHLSPSEKAVSLAFNRLASDHLVACMGYARNYEYFDKTLEVYGFKKTGWIKNMIVRSVRKNTLARLKANGIGVHTREEIYNIGNEDLKAISDFLGSKKFIMGDKPSQADAALFGILTSTMWIPLEFPCKEFALRECPNLQAYLLRIKEEYFAETTEPWYTGGLYPVPLENGVTNVQVVA
ncbi:hypothetical protein HDV05_002006 [Chytridiales sp. JEL 0842]|nr:hypothetical protein HDV05_002006 [Chytridiales sp. JEL 0842]